MHSLIRSKGFIWLSNSHMQIFYWALAGKHFELKQYATWWARRVTCRPGQQPQGQPVPRAASLRPDRLHPLIHKNGLRARWAAVPRDEWPTEEKEVADILKDFDDGDYGDRRQELVFIGVNMDRVAITNLLDACLLTDSELLAYKKRERDDTQDAATSA